MQEKEEDEDKGTERTARSVAVGTTSATTRTIATTCIYLANTAKCEIAKNGNGLAILASSNACKITTCSGLLLGALFAPPGNSCTFLLLHALAGFATARGKKKKNTTKPRKKPDETSKIKNPKCGNSNCENE